MQSGDTVDITFREKSSSYEMGDILIHPANGRTDTFVFNEDGSIAFDLCADNIMPNENPSLLCHRCGKSIGKLQNMPMQWPDKMGGYLHAEPISKQCSKCNQKYIITFGSYSG